LTLLLFFLIRSTFYKPITADAWTHEAIKYVQGDISDRATVMDVLKGADCVWHLAAAVGPYHPEEVYTKVCS
jgi:nucleoside-diphosphate-sugar epimerase